MRAISFICLFDLPVLDWIWVIIDKNEANDELNTILKFWLTSESRAIDSLLNGDDSNFFVIKWWC